MPSGVVRAAADCVRVEPALVELLGDEAADVRVEAERPVEEDAAVRRDRRVVAHQVAEHRRLAPVGMRALEHLVELLRVADEHRRPGARSPSRTRPPARPGRPRRRRGSRSASRGGRLRTARPSRRRRRGRRSPRCRRRSRRPAPRTPTRSSRGSPSSRPGTAAHARPRRSRPRRGACGSPGGSSRRRRHSSLPRRAARSAFRPSRSCRSRAGPGSRDALGRGRPTGRASASPRPIASSSSASSSTSVVWTSRPKASRRRIDSSTGYAPPAVEQRPAEPLQRLLLRLRRVDVARDQRPRERHLVEHGAALQLERARVGIVVDNLARAPAASPGRPESRRASAAAAGT